jgi:hypothetical protein
MARTDDNGARELGMKDAALLSISKSGELAIRLNTVYHGGMPARNPRPSALSGGTPRRCYRLGSGRRNMALVRFVPGAAIGSWSLQEQGAG